MNPIGVNAWLWASPPGSGAPQRPGAGLGPARPRGALERPRRRFAPGPPPRAERGHPMEAGITPWTRPPARERVPSVQSRRSGGRGEGEDGADPVVAEEEGAGRRESASAGWIDQRTAPATGSPGKTSAAAGGSGRTPHRSSIGV